jgi:hypothetical protein
MGLGRDKGIERTPNEGFGVLFFERPIEFGLEIEIRS